MLRDKLSKYYATNIYYKYNFSNGESKRNLRSVLTSLFKDNII